MITVEHRAVGTASKADPHIARKIPRHHDRPVYTLLTPQAIRQQYIPRSKVPTGRKVGAHERRRHYRTLRSDRFTRMRGRTIVVPATWVGPSEAVIGNRRYRVMLDL